MSCPPVSYFADSAPSRHGPAQRQQRVAGLASAFRFLRVARRAATRGRRARALAPVVLLDRAVEVRRLAAEGGGRSHLFSSQFIPSLAFPPGGVGKRTTQMG